MTRNAMTCVFATFLISFSLPVMSEESVNIEGDTYNTVEINGQSYYLKDSGERTRSADGDSSDRGLYTGDILRRNAADPELKVSGSLLVRATEGQARDLASRYSLVLKQHIGGIALFEAGRATDLSQLATQLRQEGREVEVEVAGPLAEPN